MYPGGPRDAEDVDSKIGPTADFLADILPANTDQDDLPDDPNLDSGDGKVSADTSDADANITSPKRHAQHGKLQEGRDMLSLGASA